MSEAICDQVHRRRIEARVKSAWHNYHRSQLCVVSCFSTSKLLNIAFKFERVSKILIVES